MTKDMTHNSAHTSINNPANAITALRVVLSVAMLFFPIFSGGFYACYVAAGASDVLDGIVARRTSSTSSFGEKFDTAADIIFVSAVLIKILPEVDAPAWLLTWIFAIAIVKVGCVVFGLVRRRELIAQHTLANKIAGVLLFALPFTIGHVDIAFSGAIVCVASTIAAAWEIIFLKSFS